MSATCSPIGLTHPFRDPLSDATPRSAPRLAGLYLHRGLAHKNQAPVAELAKRLAELHPLATGIVERCAKECGVSVDALLGRNRHAGPACARQMAWHALRAIVYPSGQHLSYPQIAWATGRDHTTVMHGIKRWESRK